MTPGDGAVIKGHHKYDCNREVPLWIDHLLWFPAQFALLDEQCCSHSDDPLDVR